MKKLIGLSVLFAASVAFAEIVVNPNGTWTCSGGGCIVTNPSPGIIKICQGAICISIDSGDYIEPLKPSDPDTSRI